MRLLSKFLLVSIAGLTVMVAVFAGIGVTTIDDVLYQNSLHVLRAEIGSVARTLETKPGRALLSDKVLSETLRDQNARTRRFPFCLQSFRRTIVPAGKRPIDTFRQKHHYPPGRSTRRRRLDRC